MHPVLQLAQQHPAIVGMVAFYLFSSFVSGMPSPRPDSGVGYVWAFNSLHALAGNLGRIVMRNGNGTDPANSK